MIASERDHLILAPHLEGTGDTALTLAAMRLRPDGDRVRGQAPLRRLGLAFAGVVARECDWYPEPSMRRAAAVLRKALARRGIGRVVGYGCSMGACAAREFGRLPGPMR